MRSPSSRTGALLLVLGLLWLFRSEAADLSWHGPDTLPFFRGTTAQGLALTKLRQQTPCLANLRRLVSAAEQFAHDHADRLPQSWPDFTNEIGAASALYCPADDLHPRQTNWAHVDLGAVSYVIVAPGAVMAGEERDFLKCTVHSHVATTHQRVSSAKPYDSRGFPVASAGTLAFPRPAYQSSREAVVSIGCINQMKILGLAARSLAIDNGNLMPGSFQEIAPLLDSCSTFVCPADVLRSAAASPGSLQDSNVTYRLEAPGIPEPIGAPLLFMTCPLHGNQLLTDGSVTQGTNLYPPRLIVGHPLSRTVEPGRPIELAVLTGDPDRGPFRFQWRRLEPIDALGDPWTNTTVLVDATNRTLRIAAASPLDEGYYDVVVHDARGSSQVSGLAFLRVEPLAGATFHQADEALACFNNLIQIGWAARAFASANQDRFPDGFSDLVPFLGWPLILVCPGDTNRTAPDTWEGLDFAGLSYTFEPGGSMDPGTDPLATCRVHRYQVQAEGRVTFGDTSPLIVKQPASLETLAGRTVTLHAAVLGAELSYQWFRNNEALPDAVLRTLTLSRLALSDSGLYHVVVTNAWGSVTSTQASVTVQEIPPPRLEMVRGDPASAPTLRVDGPAGAQCWLEESPDCATWKAIGVSLLPGGWFTLPLGAMPTEGARFFRVILE